MHVSPRTRSVLLALAAGSVPLLLALSLRSQPTARANPVTEDNAAVQPARLLDGIAQERFASARMVVFGTSRIATAATMRRHVNSIAAETPGEAAILAQVNAAHRDYLVAFLHCAPVPLDAPASRRAQLPGLSVVLTASPTPPPANQVSVLQTAVPGMRPAPAHPYLTPLVVHSQAAAVSSALKTVALVQPGAPAPAGLVSAGPIPPQMAAVQQGLLFQAQGVLPTLQRGQEFCKTKGGWTVLFSPVRASGDTCLSCHTSAKRGDTLGVMVYAVSNAVNKSESTH